MIRSTMRRATAIMFAGTIVVSGTTAGAPVLPVRASADATRPATSDIGGDRGQDMGTSGAPSRAPGPARPPEPAEPAADPTKPWQPLPGPDALTHRKRHIIETVNAWARAWSRQDFETYVSAYAADFPPSGRSHEIWLALRRKHVMEKASIGIQIVAPEVQMLSSDRARVTFVQIYQSPKYSDQVNKALTLQQTDAGWRIVRERSSPLD